MNSLSANATPLDRDLFMRLLIGEMAAELEDVIGLEAAAGYISLAGIKMGERLEPIYLARYLTERLDRDQLVSALVDLKNSIDGDFFVVEQTPDRVVLGNRRCPFGKVVDGRHSLCMLTSSVFGYLAAQSQGRVGVTLEKTIAAGDPGCRVVLDFGQDDPGGAARARTFHRRDHA